MLRPTTPYRPRPPLLSRQGQARTRLLSREEEVALFKQYNAGGPLAEKARTALVEHNQGLVISITKRCHHPDLGLDFNDLVQEGNIGLLKAIDRFEHERGSKFSTFASWWIWQAISLAIMDKGDTIRIPAHAHKQIKRYCISLDTPIYKDESAGTTLHDCVAQEPLSFSETLGVLHVPLPRLIATLPPAEQRILKLRVGLASDYPGVEMILKEIGKKVGGLSHERIRQIEEGAINILKDKINDTRKLDPYAKWLEDKKALALMLPALAPEEQALFEITFKRWLIDKAAKKALRNPRTKISTLRSKLKIKLDRMYDILQSIGLQNIRSPQLLARQVELFSILEKAARAYQKAHPEQKLIPVNIMVENTGIPERLLTPLIQNNEVSLKAKGIQFRTSRRGKGKMCIKATGASEPTVKKTIEENQDRLQIRN